MPSETDPPDLPTPSNPLSQVTVHVQSDDDLQGDILSELRNGPQQIPLQKIHCKEQCKDQRDEQCTTLYDNKCSNKQEREYSFTRGTMQNRQCRKVAKQMCSRIHQEQFKDASARKCSTSNKKVGDRQLTIPFTTSWPAERTISTARPTARAAPLATPVSPASQVSGSGSSLTIPLHKPGSRKSLPYRSHLRSPSLRLALQP